MNLNKRVNSNLIYILFFFFITILLRTYNINYDDFWIDEINSFYIADPNITLQDFFLRHKTQEDSPFLFNLILRYYFKFFNYDIGIARYLPATFNILSTFIMILFYRMINKNHSPILFCFLAVFNIYMIRYAQELRLYSLYFFLFTLNIYYFNNLINQKVLKLKLDHIFFLFSSILLFLTHTFSLIIIFSYGFYSFYIFIKTRKNLRELNILLLIIIIFSLLYLYFLITNATDIHPTWIEKIDLKFFTNFFFSKFFGSRLMGGIFLICFIYLIFSSRKKIFYESKLDLFFIYLIFFTYFIPLIYSYFISPALVERYIIYVIFPIIFLISKLCMNINNKKIKFFISFLLIFSTLGNFTTETTFKQLFQKRVLHKPDFKSSFKAINDSNVNYYSLNLEKTLSARPYAANGIGKSFEIYTKKYKKIKNGDLTYFNYLNNDQIPDKFWIVCMYDMIKDCSLPKRFKRGKVIEEKFFNSLNLKLIEII